ncbi:MAG: xylulokinase [Bacillota bacterium]
MSKLLLGVDIGTSGCKAAVFDLDGKVLAQSTKPYPVYYPAPGYAEQDPCMWWDAVCEAVREVIRADGVDAKLIAGIGVDGQSWSAIPVDKNGEVLDRTPIWMDSRSADICAETVERVGFEKIFKISGNSFEPTYSTPKILWFKKIKPDVYRNAFRFLQSNSYIVYRLTGIMSQDISQGYGLHCFNMKTGKWEDEFCEELGIAREKLPEIYACHEVVGEVTGKASEETGLPKGIPVVAGGLDACCGTLGAGVIRKGQTQEQGGQAGGMSICLDEATAHPRLILSFHVVPDLWLLQGGTVGGGGSIKWFREELGAFEENLVKQTGKANVFQIMDEEASSIAPGSDGVIFLPYMAGERSPIWDKHAKGVFFGLGYDKTRKHMIRSVLEGCAYALYHNLQTAEEAGVEVKELVSMGGAANSLVWTQIKADVTAKRIKVPASDTATTLGAAILAGVGTGEYESFDEAVKRTVSIKRTHEPDMQNNRIYMKYYEIYLELYDRLKDIMAKADEIARCGE